MRPRDPLRWDCPSSARGAIFVMLTGGGLAGGKAAAGGVILAASVRLLLSGLYELAGSTSVEHAAAKR